MQASSAISFRLPPASFSAAAWPGSPLTFCFPSFPLFRFCRSLGFRFHDRLSLPLLFLTPAVFAFFRPLQFWVLTTQPLFFFSAFFTVPPPSGFPAAPSLLSLLRFFPFRPGWFPILFFRFCLLSFAVRFFSPFPVSLPQLFHRCLSSLRFVSSASFRHPSFQPFAFFRPLSVFQIRLLRFLALPFRFFPNSSRAGLFGAPSLLSLLRFSTVSFVWFPIRSCRFCLLGSLPRFLSSFPTSLPQLFRWCLPFLLLRFLCFFFRHSSFASAFFRPLPL